MYRKGRPYPDHLDAGVLDVRAAAERRSGITVQIVAFPQFGLLTNPGTIDAMAAPLGAGTDLVGGIDPGGLEGDLHGHLDAVFGLADRTGRDVDIHLHDGGEDGLAQIREIARRTVAGGRQGRIQWTRSQQIDRIREPDADRPERRLQCLLPHLPPRGIPTPRTAHSCAGGTAQPGRLRQHRSPRARLFRGRHRHRISYSRPRPLPGAARGG